MFGLFWCTAMKATPLSDTKSVTKILCYIVIVSVQGEVMFNNILQCVAFATNDQYGSGIVIVRLRGKVMFS